MKTEKEKAAEGMLYDANNDAQLQQEMYDTRCNVYRYNSLPPWENEKRDQLIRSILKLGKNGCIIIIFILMMNEK